MSEEATTRARLEEELDGLVREANREETHIILDHWRAIALSLMDDISLKEQIAQVKKEVEIVRKEDEE